MKTADQLTKDEIITAINKGWMTHDGMWFYHCLQQFGIEKTNELNLAAIEGMTQVEIYRFKKLFGFNKDKFESFEEFKSFLLNIKEIFIPDFMGADIEFTQNNSIVVGMKPDACFAYKGIKKLNQLDLYQCGVLHRIECMFKFLGLDYQLSKRIGKCFMHFEGSCQVEFKLNFP